MVDYDYLIQEEIDRLKGRNQFRKREATIRAIAEAYANDEPLTAVFDDPAVVSSRVFYAKNKDWYHDEEFADVLDKVKDLYRRRRNEERDRDAAESRHKRHEDRVRLIDATKGILSAGIRGFVKQIQDSKDNVIEMPVRELTRLLTAVLTEERREFNELPTERTDITSGDEVVETAVRIYLPDNGRDRKEGEE